MRRVYLGVLLFVLSVAAPARAAGQSAPASADLSQGKKLFETIGCYECHGYAGQGGGAGPKLIEPIAFPAFIVQLRTPRKQMPPYTAKVVSDQQAADIFAFLQSLPKPPAVESIPLLKE